MEKQMNIFRVQVGTTTRAGNLQPHYEFVCKSEQNHKSVSYHFLKKYQGLTVHVTEVNDIVIEEIKNYEELEDDRVNERKLERQIKEMLKGKTDSTLNLEIEEHLLGDQLKQKSDEVHKMGRALNEARNTLRKDITVHLQNVYSGISQWVRLTDDFYTSSNIKFTVKLKGSVTELYQNLK